MDVYTLTSECRCGKRVKIGVMALYGSIGKGPIPISGTAGDSCFIDGESCPNAESAVGLYAKSSFTGIEGYGASFGLTRLGKLTSCSLFSDGWGLEIGINILSLGRTRLTFAFEEKCDGCN
jgi:hypothetical protein